MSENISITICDHLLQGLPFKASANHGGLFAGGLPDAIIIHFTAGASAESSVKWLCNPQSKASAHVVVGRDGSITQMVPFNTVAWHAGASSYGERSGYNKFSVGIEIDNPGRLRKTEAGTFQASFGRTYPADQVIKATHRNERAESYWLAYSEPQIEAVFDLCAALCATYKIREILGHEEIAPGRKDDPGPAFPLERLRQRLLFKGRDQDALDDQTDTPLHATVSASSLNFRVSASADAAKIAPALPQGTQVEVLDTQQFTGWARILFNGKTGWVKADYLKMEQSVG